MSAKQSVQQDLAVPRGKQLSFFSTHSHSHGAVLWRLGDPLKTTAEQSSKKPINLWLLGNHGFHHQILGFPVEFALNQSIETSMNLKKSKKTTQLSMHSACILGSEDRRARAKLRRGLKVHGGRMVLLASQTCCQNKGVPHGEATKPGNSCSLRTGKSPKSEADHSTTGAILHSRAVHRRVLGGKLPTFWGLWTTIPHPYHAT